MSRHWSLRANTKDRSYWTLAVAPSWENRCHVTAGDVSMLPQGLSSKAAAGVDAQPQRPKTAHSPSPLSISTEQGESRARENTGEGNPQGEATHPA